MARSSSDLTPITDLSTPQSENTSSFGREAEKRAGTTTPSTQADSFDANTPLVKGQYRSISPLALSKSTVFSKSVDTPSKRPELNSHPLRHSKSESDLLHDMEGKKTPRHWNRQNPC